MSLTRIKVCCISSIDEVRFAVKYGADALGFVSAMPSGIGIIEESIITELASAVPAGVDSFLLTSLVDADEIIPQIIRCGTDTVQLVDSVETKVYERIRTELPHIKIVQVIHVNGENSAREAKSVSYYVDAILLDSGNPNLKIKELGGTGRTHDWSISKLICTTVKKPVFLAGGLNPENIEEAVMAVHPYGVDVCTGLRTNGHLDEIKLRSFVNKVRNC
jgi:phosphoribosylanthranilate isomerase